MECCSTELINPDRYRKSIDIIDIKRFNPPVNIDWYQKSIEIEVTKKNNVSINKIDNNR